MDEQIQRLAEAAGVEALKGPGRSWQVWQNITLRDGKAASQMVANARNGKSLIALLIAWAQNN